MAICIMVNGLMIRRMGMESISIKMGPNTLGAGEMTYSMEWECKIGPIIHHIKECTLQVKSMEKELISGATAVNILVTGKIIR